MVSDKRVKDMDLPRITVTNRLNNQVEAVDCRVFEQGRDHAMRAEAKTWPRRDSGAGPKAPSGKTGIPGAAFYALSIPRPVRRDLVTGSPVAHHDKCIFAEFFCDCFGCNRIIFWLQINAYAILMQEKLRNRTSNCEIYILGNIANHLDG